MCTFFDQLLLDCGATPTLEYTVIAGAVACLIVLLLRP
jgi:Flp pilus assembly pilin Flp